MKSRWYLSDPAAFAIALGLLLFLAGLFIWAVGGIFALAAVIVGMVVWRARRT